MSQSEERVEPTREEVDLAHEVDQEIVDLGIVPMDERQRYLLRSTVTLALARYRKRLFEGAARGLVP